MFTRRRIALACIVLVVVAASAFYGYRRYAEEQARQVALTCLELASAVDIEDMPQVCIALAVSSEPNGSTRGSNGASSRRSRRTAGRWTPATSSAGLSAAAGTDDVVRLAVEES